MRFTKERLEEIAEDGFLKHGESKELARMALAGMEAEPAGYHVIKECGAVGCSVAALKEAEETRDFWNKNWTIKPYFYTAPPVPVYVPDDVSGPLAHAYKELTPTFMRNHIDVFERYGIYPDGSAGIQAMRIALDGMNRRAAMLQGAAGNSPVIPDGWVACSERMSEAMVSVLVTGEWFNYAIAFWDGCGWCDLDYEPPVTHWQPLPAAPQQEAE